MNAREPPLVGYEDVDAARKDKTVHGVVLAAGRSERFGTENKLLATVDGEPLLRRATRPLVGACTDGVTVIVGHDATLVSAAVDGLDVRVHKNPDYREGQSTSVRAGVEAVLEQESADEAGKVDAIVFGLGDMPDVSVTTVNALVEAYETGAGDAIAATYDGQRGNPVLFDRQYFDALTELSGDRGGRGVLSTSEDAIRLVVDDPGVLRDVDTHEDIHELSPVRRD